MKSVSFKFAFSKLTPFKLEWEKLTRWRLACYKLAYGILIPEKFSPDKLMLAVVNIVIALAEAISIDLYYEDNFTKFIKLD